MPVMKSIAFKLFACALVGASANSAFNFAPGKITKENAPQELSMIMQRAQQGLSRAQRHHERVVKKVRKQVVADFSDEATTVGKQLGSFAAELEGAAQEIEVALNASKVGLAASEARSKASTSWQDPEVEDRAKLNAISGSAQRAMRKMRRKNAQALHSAEEHAEGSMEDESEKLSMKLGDLSQEYSEAKDSLESTVSEAQENVTSSTNSKPKAGASLKELEKNLSDSLAQSQTTIKAIQKKMDAFLGKVDKDVLTKGSKVEQTLDTYQKKEIAKVLGHPAK